VTGVACVLQGQANSLQLVEPPVEGPLEQAKLRRGKTAAAEEPTTEFQVRPAGAGIPLM